MPNDSIIDFTREENMSSKLAVRLIPVVAAALLVGASACKTKEEAKTPLANIGQQQPQENPARAAMSPEARAALDSGNALFREKKFDAALASYRKAAEAAPTSPAPWYGVYMAAQALGNQKLADSAMKQVQTRTGGESPMWSDSSMKKMHSTGEKPTTE